MTTLQQKRSNKQDWNNDVEMSSIQEIEEEEEEEEERYLPGAVPDVQIRVQSSARPTAFSATPTPPRSSTRSAAGSGASSPSFGKPTTPTTYNHGARGSASPSPVPSNASSGSGRGRAKRKVVVAEESADTRVGATSPSFDAPPSTLRSHTTKRVAGLSDVLGSVRLPSRGSTIRQSKGDTLASVGGAATRVDEDNAADDDGEGVAPAPWWRRILRWLGGGMCARPVVRLTDVGLNEEQIEQVKMLVPFTDRELERLCARFVEIDTSGDGVISFDEFMEMPEFRASPLRHRLFHAFDHSPDASITFSEFVESMAVFCDRTPKSRKIRFLFAIYDCDDDGFVSREDLQQILFAILGGNPTPENVAAIIDRVFAEADLNGDGLLDFREFASVVAATDLNLRMRLSF